MYKRQITRRNRAHLHVGESGVGVERLVHFSSIEAYVPVTLSLDRFSPEHVMLFLLREEEISKAVYVCFVYITCNIASANNYSSQSY